MVSSHQAAHDNFAIAVSIPMPRRCCDQLEPAGSFIIVRLQKTLKRFSNGARFGHYLHLSRGQPHGAAVEAALRRVGVLACVLLED
jgi:hypothetical protein